MRRGRWFALAIVSTAPILFCKEVIQLKSGFELTVDSHVQCGGSIEAQSGTGSMVFAASDVAKIEPLPPASTPDTPSEKQTEQLRPDDTLLKTALEQGVDKAFVRSVAVIESGLVQKRVSSKGAIGLMQLMPQTAKSLGVDPTRMEENARGGVQYLRSLLIQYKGDSVLALAAYNAGPGAVRKFQGVPPYSETRRYIVSVLKEYQRQLERQKAALASVLPTVKVPNTPSAKDLLPQ